MTTSGEKTSEQAMEGCGHEQERGTLVLVLLQGLTLGLTFPEG